MKIANEVLETTEVALLGVRAEASDLHVPFHAAVGTFPSPSPFLRGHSCPPWVTPGARKKKDAPGRQRPYATGALREEPAPLGRGRAAYLNSTAKRFRSMPLMPNSA